MGVAIGHGGLPAQPQKSPCLKVTGSKLLQKKLPRLLCTYQPASVGTAILVCCFYFHFPVLPLNEQPYM